VTSPRLLAATAVAAGVLSGGARAPVITVIPGTPPIEQHAPRPELDAATQAALKEPPLVADGEARVAAAPRLTAGQAFVEIPVRHGLTGELVADVAIKEWFSGGKLPGGLPVFGVPMAGPDGPTLVWCAPQPAKKPQADGRPLQQVSICLPFGDKTHVWVEGRPALLPVGLTWSNGAARRTSRPEVRRGPQAFPPMTLSYAFAGLDARGWVRVETRLDWGEGPQTLRAIALPPGADGAALVRAAGGAFALKPAGAEVVVEVRAPPAPGAPVVY